MGEAHNAEAHDGEGHDGEAHDAEAHNAEAHNAEAERSDAIAEEIAGLLDDVASLDEDRILRSYLTLVRATLRTNYFQCDNADPGAHKPYLVVKLDPAQAPDLPAPRPRFEVFVYSPRLEGVHLQVRPGGARRAALVGPA